MKILYPPGPKHSPALSRRRHQYVRRNFSLSWSRLLVLVFGLQALLLVYLSTMDSSGSPAASLTAMSQSRDGMREQLRRRSLAKAEAKEPDGFANPKSAQLASPLGIGIFAKNPFSQDRIVCGQTVPANGMLEVQKPCSMRSQLFKQTPTISAQGMPPIWVKYHNQIANVKERTCDVPCQYTGGVHMVTPAYIDGTDWKFTFSMEGTYYHPNAAVDLRAYQEDHYYATTSFKSDIPLPYYSETEYTIQHPGVDYDKALKGASFIANNCESANHREDVALALMQSNVFGVESLSGCLHNSRPPPGVHDMSNKTAVMERYLFHLAFENQNEEDYITEKLWGVLSSGTVPIYFGAPNVKEHAPPNSIIVVDDYDSLKDLAIYLEKVAANKTLYETYHAWRKQPLAESFHRKYAFSRTHSTCRLCRWVHAKKHGLGWDHEQQQLVEELKVPRTTCLDENGMVQRPFQEKWITAIGVFMSTETDSHNQANKRSPVCNLQENSENDDRILPLSEQSNGNWKRTVWDNDGVTDFVVEGMKNVGLKLQLTTPLGSETIRTSVSQREFWLQDSQSRMTILTSQDLDLDDMSAQVLSSRGVAVVEITFTSAMNIRIIVEDLDTLHVGATERANYFGKIMTEDFFHPIEYQTTSGHVQSS
jgi:hypothetical protein